jgi:hypothetical protein
VSPPASSVALKVEPSRCSSSAGAPAVRIALAPGMNLPSVEMPDSVVPWLEGVRPTSVWI